MENFVSKFGYKYYMVDEKELTVELKKCKICGIDKPLSNFSDDKKAKDRKYSWCKECKNNKQKKRFGNLSKQDKINLSRKQEISRTKTLIMWEPILKRIYNVEKFVCECCGKELVFPTLWNGNSYNSSIYFDHRSSDVKIKGSPSRWLYAHSSNKQKNIDTFKSCDFGILRKNCNTRLGKPENRKQRVLQDYNYVFGGPLNQSSKKEVQLESSGGAR